MSGVSYTVRCPNCNQDAKAESESRPYDWTEIICANCGFQTLVSVKYMDLEELNDLRTRWDLPPLTELPEQIFY